MRAVALANGRVPFFTAEGSIAVALFGAAAGAGVGVIFLFARFAAPNRRAVRLALFSGGCAFLVLRGLRPLTILSITIFGSLFVVHAALLHVYWCRIHIPHRVRPSRGP
jgi:hypothetical protein